MCHLQSLDLFVSSLSASALEPLTKIHRPRLQQLDLSGNSLTASIQQLTKMHLPCLEEMVLSDNGLTASAIEQLTKASWPCLKRLDLSRNRLTASATEQLNACWPSLEQLDLSSNRLSASAIQQLSNGCWPCLESLFFKHTSIDASAMTQLVCGEWPRLSVLDIRGVAVGAPVFQALLKAVRREMFKTYLTLQNTATLKLVLACRSLWNCKTRDLLQINCDIEQTYDVWLYLRSSTYLMAACLCERRSRKSTTSWRPFPHACFGKAWI